MPVQHAAIRSRSRSALVRALAPALGLLLALLPLDGPAQTFGLNARHAEALNPAVAALARQRNFRSLRLDMLWPADASALRDHALRMRAQGGNVQAVLQISKQWDSSCNPDLAWVEHDAYRQTAAAVNQVKDVIQDFEILNESQLRPEITREVPWNSAGTSTAPYEGKPCVATLTAALRGMSRAIVDVRASSGLPLRIILGMIGRDFGFLTHMRNNGVRWDVTGYHNYPHYGTPSMLLGDSWYGGGGLMAQLATFGKPVHMNEFNCGELFDADYGNSDGDPKTEACLKSLVRHLKDLKKQTAARLEAIHFYELFDEPHKTAAESRAGLMYSLARAKPQLAIATAFAGGALTPQERLDITRRGLLSEAEIADLRAAATPPSPRNAP